MAEVRRPSRVVTFALATLVAAVALTLTISSKARFAAQMTQTHAVSPPATVSTSFPTYPTDYPPFKQTAEIGVEQTRQALILTITPNTPSHIRPPTYTLEPFIPGVFDSQAAPVSAMEYTMTNWWQDILNGERTRVFAGARQDKSSPTYGPAQGVVLVSVSGIDLINWAFTGYDAPPNTGVLQITGVNGFRLSLQDDKGTVLYFDVPSRQFVDSLSTTSSAPTATLLPTVTPDIPIPSPTGAPYPYPQPTALATTSP